MSDKAEVIDRTDQATMCKSETETETEMFQKTNRSNCTHDVCTMYMYSAWIQMHEIIEVSSKQ